MEAVIRRTPEDFEVEEIPAYSPSGRGEHLFITFRKRGITTLDAVRDIARALGVDPRGTGHAGLKDKHAVTTQTASFALPMARDAAEAVARVALPGIEILAAARHDNKLKPGHLLGNRFTIAMEIAAGDEAALTERLAEIGRVGVPNAFGPQRFGRDGDNPERALAWLAGKERGPRSPREQQLLFSALQSLLFNRVLERRVALGTWATVLPGDVAKKHDTGGLFTVPREGPELDDARARAEAGSLSATGPMFGAKMRSAEGEPAEIEREVLAAAWPEPLDLGRVKHLGEGTRRALRLFVAEMAVETRPAREDGRRVVVARFVLPKGGYATTVLGGACRLVDASRGGSPDRLDRPDRSGSTEPGGEPAADDADDPREP